MIEERIGAEADGSLTSSSKAAGERSVQDLLQQASPLDHSEMMGVPESMRRDLYSAAEAQIASQDPEFAGDAEESATVAFRRA